MPMLDLLAPVPNGCNEGWEAPLHSHHLGQLVFALKGGATCEAVDAVWMVPPRQAVWIPADAPHSIQATANAQLCYLFIQQGAAPLPDRCCTFAVSPLMRELALHITTQPWDYDMAGPTGRKAQVVLDELAEMEPGGLHVPISSDQRMRHMANMLARDPADRRTLADWSESLAMSERTLARLVHRETGLSFGRWRQQWQVIAAMYQLAGGDSVQAVSGRLGYESVSAFVTMFRKVVGKPPARFFADIESGSAVAPWR